MTEEKKCCGNCNGNGGCGKPEPKFRIVNHFGDWPGPPQFDGPNDPVTLVNCIPFIKPEDLGVTPKERK